MGNTNFNYDALPADMLRWPQWCVNDIRNPDPDWSPKQPIDAKSLRPAKVNNPLTFSDYDTALRRVRNGDAAGLGFVFTEADPFVMLDWDTCRNPADGKGVEDVRRVMTRFRSFWGEVSASGWGFHFIIQAAHVTLASGEHKLKLPDRGLRRPDIDRHTRQQRVKNGVPQFKAPEFEMYSHGHFLAMTGWKSSPAPRLEDQTAELLALRDELFPPAPVPAAEAPAPRVGTAGADVFDEWLPRDRELQARLAGERRSGDESTDDWVLCKMLLFYTGGDVERTTEIFLNSDYTAMKDTYHAAKVHDRADYLPGTIKRAMRSITTAASVANCLYNQAYPPPGAAFLDGLPGPFAAFMTDKGD